MSRIQAFDGLKGLSILVIILYHLWPNIVPGGFLAVNAFLVLSGYFMGNKLTNLQGEDQWGQTLNYVKKTVERIFFPLLWFLMLIVVFYLIFDPQALKSMQAELIASLTFANNFFQLASDRSYFTDMAVASPVTHLWYIAIYMQSFLVSLPLIIISNAIPGRRTRKAGLWLLIFVVSVVINTMRYQPGDDPSNVYYGFWPRYASFAVGILTAYLVPVIQRRLSAQNSPRQIAIAGNSLSLMALLMMVGAIFTVNDQAPMSYYLWLPYFNIWTAVLIVGCLLSSSWLDLLLGNRLLAWMGKRSYSFYLWYYPIIVWSNSFLRYFQGRVDLLKTLSFIVILLVGWIFYQLLESDKYYYLFGSSFNLKADAQTFRQHFKGKLKFTPLLGRSLIYLGLAIAFVVGLIYADNDKPTALFELEYRNYRANPSPTHPIYQQEEQIRNNMAPVEALDQQLDTNLQGQVEFTGKEPEEYLRRVTLSEEEASVQAIDSSLSEDDQAILDSVAYYNPELIDLLSPEEIIYANTLPVTLFGDSLARFLGPSLGTLYHYSHTYGYVSLELWDAIDILQDLIADGLVEDTLIINIGTNAGLDQAGLDQLITVAGPREIYLINTNSAVEHVGRVNELIRQAASNYDNVHEVDWYTASQGHPEYYAEDDIHLSDPGMNQLTALLAQLMYQNR